MGVFKFVVSDPKTRKTYQLEVDQDKAIGLIGKRLGENFNGDLIGLTGYELQLRGGTDKDGFPMHPQVHGSGKKRLVLAGPPCFHHRIKGQRRRKMVRGNTLSKDIVQINCKVIKIGKKPLVELIGKKEPKKEEKVEEKPKEEKKEQPKKDVKEEKVEEKKPEVTKEEVVQKEEKSKEELKEEPKKEAPKPETPKEEQKTEEKKEKVKPEKK